MHCTVVVLVLDESDDDAMAEDIGDKSIIMIYHHYLHVRTDDKL